MTGAKPSRMTYGKNASVAALFVFASLGALSSGFGWGCVSAFADQKTPAQLEADYDRETNPKKRTRLAVDLMEERLNQVLTAFDSEDRGGEKEAADNYLAAMDRLEKALNGMSSMGTVKNAEIHLRVQTKKLRDLRVKLSLQEQAIADKPIERITALHERLLNTIMNPRE